MRVRALLILTTMVLGVLLLGGVVLAVTRTCTTDLCRGTNGSDRLTGDGRANQIYGLGGDDYVAGGRGKDYLSGGRGLDSVAGKLGYDTIIGAETNLRRPYSYKVHYQVQGGGRTERLLGGGGNDTIRARDGREDIIRGGPGRDKAYVDQIDSVAGVEKEVVPGGGGGTGGGPPQPKQCNDGQDNDNDGKTDLQDPGCASANDDSESPDPTITKKQCNDGQDNDNDGKIDFGNGANNDPGCDSLTDDTENSDTIAPPPQCEDGKDNDGDGKIDFGNGANNDPGCDSLTDDTENTPPKNTPPVAKDDSYQLSIKNCNGSKAVHLTVDAPNGVLGNDTDADADPLKAVEVNPPTHGILTLNADGSFTYEATDGVCPDPDSFTYKTTDGAADSNVATVSLNPPPNVP